jgi:hypothetical protein
LLELVMQRVFEHSGSRRSLRPDLNVFHFHFTVFGDEVDAPEAVMISMDSVSTSLGSNRTIVPKHVDATSHHTGFASESKSACVSLQIGDVHAVQPADTVGAFIVTHESVRVALEIWMMEHIARLMRTICVLKLVLFASCLFSIR